MKRWMFVLLFVILISFVSAQTTSNVIQNVTGNVSFEVQAKDCLQQSVFVMDEMQNNGFLIIRVNDSIRQAKNLYNSQVVLMDKKKPYDFSLILPYCEEIVKIKDWAYSSRDELIALEKFYEISRIEGMNTSSIDAMILEIKQEIQNERYEKVSPLIQNTYTEITKVSSAYTTLGIFYSSTTRSLGKFLMENWIWIASTFVFLIIFYIVYRKAISRILVRRKIDKLTLRKKTLKDMVMQTQRDYFNTGKMSESTFNIRTKKLVELIRDIDRQVPLLEEKLARVKKK